MLHPAGPEEEDDDDDDDEEEEEEGNDKEDSNKKGEKKEDGFDMEEYKHAVLELEGLKVRYTHTDIQNEDNKREMGEEQTVTETEPSSRINDETEEKLEEELNEAEDDCPELSDLSYSNKEFKPFR